MQRIQWFPGHMTKAMRMMEDNLKFVQCVVIVLDARAPFACVNPKLDALFNNKKILYALNKSDMVTNADVKRLTEKFAAEGKTAVAVSANDKQSVSRLKSALFRLADDILKRNEEKGVFKALRVMVTGIPNTGKSTLINALVGAKKAVTGDKAGVTRSAQWVKLEALELMDTPGTMPPAFDNQIAAEHLAFIGSVNDDILDFNDLTLELLKELKAKYPALLKARYGIENTDKTPLELYDDICRKRGFLMKGGEFDYERAASSIIDDLRKGRIGKICFE